MSNGRDFENVGMAPVAWITSTKYHKDSILSFGKADNLPSYMQTSPLYSADQLATLQAKLEHAENVNAELLALLGRRSERAELRKVLAKYEEKKS